MLRKYSCGLVLVCLGLGPGSVGAQDTYQANEFRLEQCKIVAMRASTAWKYREANEEFPMNMLPADNPMTVVHVWAINYTMHDATSRDDAIRTSIAKCLDNVDKVFRYYRSGKFLTQESLN